MSGVARQASVLENEERDQRPPSFGQLLRQYRAASGLTQEQLAEQAGISVRGLSDLERGIRRVPYADTLTRLADALHLTVQERGILGAARRQSSVKDISNGSRFARPNWFGVERGHQSATNYIGSSSGGRMPVQLTSFVGRDRETVELQHLLQSARLVTLVGPVAWAKRDWLLRRSPFAYFRKSARENGPKLQESLPYAD